MGAGKSSDPLIVPRGTRPRRRGFRGRVGGPYFLERSGRFRRHPVSEPSAGRASCGRRAVHTADDRRRGCTADRSPGSASCLAFSPGRGSRRIPPGASGAPPPGGSRPSPSLPLETRLQYMSLALGRPIAYDQPETLMGARAKCRVCRRGFTPTRRNRRYCSDACRDRALTRSCGVCGRIFRMRIDSPGRYCSRACRNEALVALVRSRPRLPPQGTCEVCGTPVHTARLCRRCYIASRSRRLATCRECRECGATFRLTEFERAYCSEECRSRALTRTCLHCGRVFRVKSLSGAPGRYCSRACRNKAYPLQGKGRPRVWPQARCVSPGCDAPLTHRDARRCRKHHFESRRYCRWTDCKLGGVPTAVKDRSRRWWHAECLAMYRKAVRRGPPEKERIQRDCKRCGQPIEGLVPSAYARRRYHGPCWREVRGTKAGRKPETRTRTCSLEGCIRKTRRPPSQNAAKHVFCSRAHYHEWRAQLETTAKRYRTRRIQVRCRKCATTREYRQRRLPPTVTLDPARAVGTWTCPKCRNARRCARYPACRKRVKRWGTKTMYCSRKCAARARKGVERRDAALDREIQGAFEGGARPSLGQLAVKTGRSRATCFRYIRRLGLETAGGRRRRVRRKHRGREPRPIAQGTPEGYRAHSRRSEDACQPCRDAVATRRREERHRRRDEERPLALYDVASIFARERAAQLSSASLASAMQALEGRPWKAWNRGRPLTAYGLASLLKPLGVASAHLYVNGKQFTGYRLEDVDRGLASERRDGNRGSRRRGRRRSSVRGRHRAAGREGY